ncbi:phosphopantetheine-binding protein [Nocardia takedensis]
MGRHSGPHDDDNASDSDITSLAALAAAWTHVLGVPQVRASDDFFALGGHSVTAVRLIDLIETEFGVALGLADIFESPRLRELAALIDAHAADTQVPSHDHEHRTGGRT